MVINTTETKRDGVSHDFIGRGIAFPMRVDGAGGIALVGHTDGIERSLRMVLSTAPGERLMRPEFGCRIHEMVFAPVNSTTLGEMAQAVRQAVARWEPRVDLHEVRVKPDPERPALVVIEVDYVVRGSNDRRNLVYPFYLIPEEGER